jgi:hypothetical protein
MLRKHTTSGSDYCSGLCVEGVRKSTKCLCQKFGVRLKFEQGRHFKKINQKRYRLSQQRRLPQELNSEALLPEPAT